MDIVCRPALLDEPFGVFRRFGNLDFSFSSVMLELSVLLVLTHLLRGLLRPFHQPKVISDILAGIIVGPSVLSLSSKFGTVVLPDTNIYVTRNLGLIGFMYFMFISGVKMDLSVIKRSTRREWIIASIGLGIPYIIDTAVGFGIRSYMDPEMAKFGTFNGILFMTVITTFPVIYAILEDLNLLSSEIGRLALAVVVISDAIGLFAINAFEATKQSEFRSINAVYYLASATVVFSLLLFALPILTFWINDNLPEDKPVNSDLVTVFLLGALSVGFVTDFIGAAVANGPLWLGLAIPDGPPLGSTIVERSEVIMTQLFLPFTFASIGSLANVFYLPMCWSCLGPIFVLAIVGYVSKFGSILAASLYYDIPMREALTLALMMSLRGQMEFLLYLHWVDWRMVNLNHYTMMVLLTILNTVICAPLISYLYDPTRPYMTNKRRTIQHNQPNTDLRVLACIYDQDCLNSLFGLLDVSNPSPSNPFLILAVHLTELKGRAAPVFIDHSEHEEYWDANDESIHSALNAYEEARSDYTRIHFFTSVAAQRTMYQDICEMGLRQKASFIILPFHKKSMVALSGPGTVRPGLQAINSNCLLHAPCSVGILVCKGSIQPSIAPTNADDSKEAKRFAVIFLGGPDAREALSYADRMVGDPNIYLTVVRFLPASYEGENELERKLDDGVVTAFWVKNEGNERVIYREVVVTNGADTITAIHAMNEDDGYDLWIVGRKYGVNPILLEGLSDVCENPELGTIGNFLSSSDFSTKASVLVLQQQILRDQRTRTL